jgi:hypothetical protein
MEINYFLYSIYFLCIQIIISCEIWVYLMKEEGVKLVLLANISLVSDMIRSWKCSPRVRKFQTFTYNWESNVLFWPHYCLSFFDLQLLIIPLLSSNITCHKERSNLKFRHSVRDIFRVTKIKDTMYKLNTLCIN